MNPEKGITGLTPSGSSPVTWRRLDGSIGVAFTADELHCLTCAMAGNFPERFGPIRMDLLRKLAKATRVSRTEVSS